MTFKFKGLIFILWMWTFLLTSFQLALAQQEQHNWIELFNGQDLSGWIQRGGEANYFVDKGMIVGETVRNTPNTFLCTVNHYCNFVLEFEVKIDSALNSGVQVRSNSYADVQNGRVHGYQVEIDPSQRAYSGGIYEEARRGWLFNLDGNEAAQDAFNGGSWNHFKVKANGSRIQTWVNGIPVADLSDKATSCGFIGLQVHATDRKEPLQVRWRNIRIRYL